jgi:uncharacterized protein (TIGR02145 family)
MIFLWSGCQKNNNPNAAVTVNITSPSVGASIYQGENVTISVDATSSFSTIRKVRLFINNEDVAADDTPPYQFDWNTTAVVPGEFSIRAEADNSTGNTGFDEVSISVDSLYTPGSFTDNRDGKTYKTVTLGTQTWMAENLNYETDTGSLIYNDNPEPYGRYYNWYTAMVICPEGWHLPSDGEWSTLIDFLGGEYVAGGKMKSTTNHWESHNAGATNLSGFTGLPGGMYWNESIGFRNEGFLAYFSTSTEVGKHANQIRFLQYVDATVYTTIYVKSDLFNVRCVKDD